MEQSSEAEAPGPPFRTRPRRPTLTERMKDAVPAIIGLGIIAIIMQLGLSADRSDRMVVAANGKLISVPHPATVSRAISVHGVRPRHGHLRAVDGKILRRDGGSAPDIWADGRRAGLSARLVPGSRVTWTNGRDLIEHLRDVVTVSRPGVEGDAAGDGGVVVIRSGQDLVLRERRGLESKRSVIVRRITDPITRPGSESPGEPGVDRAVALTFDDGPSPRATAQILAILRKYKVKATFFMLGRSAAESPGLVQAVVKDGHEAAFHSFRHADPSKQSARELRDDFDKGLAVFNRLGVYPLWYRSPEGVTSPRLSKELRERGMLMVLWNADSADWSAKKPKQLVARVKQIVSPGSVVVLHDGGGDRHVTIQALPGIIKGLRKKGYRLVTVGEMMRPDKRMATAIEP